MSYMSALATAGISTEEMATYLAASPGIGFDKALGEIQYEQIARRDWEREIYAQCDKEDQEDKAMKCRY